MEISYIICYWKICLWTLVRNFIHTRYYVYVFNKHPLCLFTCCLRIGLGQMTMDEDLVVVLTVSDILS